MVIYCSTLKKGNGQITLQRVTKKAKMATPEQHNLDN